MNTESKATEAFGLVKTFATFGGFAEPKMQAIIDNAVAQQRAQTLRDCFMLIDSLEVEYDSSRANAYKEIAALIENHMRALGIEVEE